LQLAQMGSSPFRVCTFSSAVLSFADELFTLLLGSSSFRDIMQCQEFSDERAFIIAKGPGRGFDPLPGRTGQRNFKRG